ncbi:MAG: Hsp70 family protein [Anaerolineaceae bacterium]|nr:Hsp70 family protein [Anaerolineaceae bacterium]
MSGRIAVDFGTSNTLIAIWDPSQRSSETCYIPEYCKRLTQGSVTINLIPSLIHYATDNRQWIGQQVIDRNLYQSERTFRWMKRYISNRTPMKIRLSDKEITPAMAAEDFLNAVLVFSIREIANENEEVAFSVPVEAFEHYEDWLSRLAERAGIRRYRLIDEPSAAALGYGEHIQPGNVYLIFDFGGGTMHASVVLIEPDTAATTGKRCRVLGKAGKDIGGTSIDQWIFQDVLKKNRRQDFEPEIRKLSTEFLVECEKLKENLTLDETAELSLSDPEKNTFLKSSYNRNEFEDLLEKNNLFTDINKTVRAALNQAREKGYDEESVMSVLMVGGSSQIPAVQKVLRQIFGREKVKCDRPMDAVVRGAAAFVGGAEFFDHIQHNYSIRYLDPKTGVYKYQTIVPRGTIYPTQEPVTRLTVKAAFDGQTDLGIAIFEMSGAQKHAEPQFEMIFDPAGAARIMQVSAEQFEQRSMFWMNESAPTFITASPPAKLGEPRFEVEFNVDQNKRLIITARDRINGKLIFQEYPVIKLT